MSKLTNLDNLNKLSKALNDNTKEIVDKEKARALVEEQALQTEINNTRDMFGGRSIRYVTQAEYDILTEEEKDSLEIIYFITDAEDSSHNHDNKEFLDNLAARNISIGNKSQLFNGVDDLVYSIEDIGAAPAEHNHDDNYYTENEIDLKLEDVNKAINELDEDKLKLEDLPCYDTRVFEEYSIEYDGIADGKETGRLQKGPYAYNFYIKVAEVSEEEYNIYKTGLSEGYTVTYKNSGDEELTTAYCEETYVDEENGMMILYNQRIIITKNPVEVVGGYGGGMDFPSAGVYFQKSVVYKLDYKKTEGEFKALDKKFLKDIDLVGATAEEGTTHNDITDDEQYFYTVKKGAEIFNNYTANIATGMYSHAEGNYTRAFGDYAHAEGDCTVASGQGSHAEGEQCKARGEYSHAEGCFTKAVGDYAHAEGEFSNAIGNNSHAEGGSTNAVGDSSHAEGAATTANNLASHAEGYYTIASGDYQHVQGRFNIEDTTNTYAHIVGNGNVINSVRSNAHTLDWDGNAWFAGKATVSAQPTDDNDLTTKLYVDEAIAQASIDGKIDTTEFALKSELLDKQDKEDENLNTENKTIVGAINELEADMIEFEDVREIEGIENSIIGRIVDIEKKLDIFQNFSNSINLLNFEKNIGGVE